MMVPASHPGQHVHPKRRYPRVSIMTPVEIHLRERIGPPIVGRIENLSAGGLLAACRELFQPRAELTMHFSLPTGYSIQAFGRVVYSVPGSRYGVEFMDLDGDASQQIQQFTLKLLGYKRRSSRVPLRTKLVIRASEDSADLEMAETVLVSREGGLLICHGMYSKGEEIYLWSPERHRGAYARVVFQQIWAADTLVELGFEFIEDADLWDIPLASEKTRSLEGSGGPVRETAAVPRRPLMQLRARSMAPMSWRQNALAGFSVAMFIFVAGEALDWLLAHGFVPHIVNMLTDVVVALSVGCLVFKILCDAQDRHNAMVNRLERIAEINHHIRNALQVIAYHARSEGSQNQKVIEDVNAAVTRIEWVLREVLPEGEHPRRSESPTSRKWKGTLKG